MAIILILKGNALKKNNKAPPEKLKVGEIWGCTVLVCIERVHPTDNRAWTWLDIMEAILSHRCVSHHKMDFPVYFLSKS